MTTCNKCASVEIPEFFEGDHGALQACMASDHTCGISEQENQADILDAMFDL